MIAHQSLPDSNAFLKDGHYNRLAHFHPMSALNADCRLPIAEWRVTKGQSAIADRNSESVVLT